MNQLFKELPLNQQDAILSIIEEKTNEDMKAVITEIHKLKNDMDSKFNAKFDAIDSKFNAIDSKFTTVFWILGVLTTVLIAILSKLLF